MIAFHPVRILIAIKSVLPFLSVTLLVTLLTAIIGTGLGILIAKAALSSHRMSRFLSSSFVGVLRCTPPIVLIFLVYYGVPRLLLVFSGVDINFWNRGLFIVIALSLLFAANSAEVFRASYLAIPSGQTEAGVTAGLSEFQTFWRIVLPQAAAVALPNYITQVLNLIKDGSLAYTIGLVDVMGAGQGLIARNLGNYAIETYLGVTLIYWGIAFVLESLSHLFENYFTRGKKKYGRQVA